MTNKIYICSLLTVITLPTIISHSWLECTDYNTDVLGPYSKSNCRGFPRGFKNQFEVEFGVDTGFNVESNFIDSLICTKRYNPNLYNDQIKMATFKPGQIINLVWPAKNHVAAKCTNEFIPDQGVYITRGSVPMLEDFNINITSINPKHTNGVIDFKGFQRCFNFCDNTDKSPCINSFQLDNDFKASGIYVFKFVWQFNLGEFYTTCFDAFVSVDGSTPQQSSTTPQPSTSNSTPSNTEPTIIAPVPTPAIPTPAITTPPTTEPTITAPTPSTTDELITDEPITDEPITDEPITDEPITDEPITDEPTTKKPDIITSGASDTSSFISKIINHIFHMNVDLMNYINKSKIEIANIINITVT